MLNSYNINGLVFWTEKEIRLRQMFQEHFTAELKEHLNSLNTAWKWFQVEAPILTPQNVINPNYTAEDVFFQENKEGEQKLVLRPETTPGSYVYAQHLITQGLLTPIVVWQVGKSFRREADQVTKNMRLKEFYQQEFQCIYTTDTANDYYTHTLEAVRRMIADLIKLPTRIVASDRLPSYSLQTTDIEVNNGDKWMEVCSISKRIDFPQKVVFSTKKGVVEKDVYVLEVAIGLDRCVYNYQKGQELYNIASNDTSASQ